MTLAQVLRLPGVDLELELCLRRLDELTPRHHGRCWIGNGRLAILLKRSVRTVQLWLKRLEELVPGFRRVKNYRLNSRREIVLPWRQERSLFSPELSAMDCAPVAPSSAVPPGPPLEVPDGALDLTTGTSSPAELPSSGNPELEAQALSLAQAVYGPAGATSARIDAAARRFGWATFLDGLRASQRKLRREGRVFWGYLVRACEGIEREGRPAPVPIPVVEDLEERRARILARLASQREGRSP